MEYRDRIEKIKNRLKDQKVLISGILNATPDSFSDGGSYCNVDAAVKRALEMEAEGAEIIDIGGESTRPGYTPVSVDEELSRIIPIIDGIRQHSDVAISVDTMKAAVALEAIKHQVCIVNDVLAAADEKMLPVVADEGALYIWMHNRDNTDYKDFYAEYLQDIENGLKKVRSHGIEEDRILLDPGVGFAKDTNQNLIVINKLEELKRFGVNIYLGASRKSVIGNTLNLPVTERLEGSLAIAVYGGLNGAKVVRVHDVKETVRAIRMTEAIVNICL